MIPWEARTRPAPWIAANTRAVEYIRIHEGIGGGSWSEREWRDGDRHRVSIDDTEEALQKFMHGTGMFNAWPNSESVNHVGLQRFAPYRFVVISIDPTVVLMARFDFGPRQGRSDNDMIYPTEPTKCMDNDYMINWIECDISAPYEAGMQWLSHDLKQPPSAIPWRDGRAELPIGDDLLVLTHDGAAVQTQRLRRK